LENKRNWLHAIVSYFNTDQDNGLFIIIIILQLSVRTDVLSEPHFLLEEQKLWQQVFAELVENETKSTRSLTFLDSSWTDVRFSFPAVFGGIFAK
jgi:hypothetical protein